MKVVVVSFLSVVNIRDGRTFREVLACPSSLVLMIDDVVVVSLLSVENIRDGRTFRKVKETRYTRVVGILWRHAAAWLLPQFSHAEKRGWSRLVVIREDVSASKPGAGR